MKLCLNPENDQDSNIMREICNYFIDRNMPKSFNPISKNNVIVSNEKMFESVCTNLEESGAKTENMSIFSFYARIEHFEKRYNDLIRNGIR